MLQFLFSVLGFITVYSVDADGAYFVRMEFEAHNKGISCLVMLSEGTLLSGGERDRKICAWDSLQNYKKITEIKVSKCQMISVFYNFLL
jgi:echinoderm microtubule-associated protein-like 1/2